MRSRSRKRGLGLRQDIEGAEAGRFLALRQINARAKLACDGHACRRASGNWPEMNSKFPTWRKGT